MSRRTFRSRISTPLSTTAASPLSTTVTLARGTLERLTVVIPSGHAGLTGIALEDASEHIFPWGDGAWLQGDDEVIDVRLDYVLSGSTIVVRSYNTDDTYPHDHLLRFQVLDDVGPARRIVRPLPITPEELNIPDIPDIDVDVPDVGDELVDVTPDNGEDVTP